MQEIALGLGKWLDMQSHLTYYVKRIKNPKLSADLPPSKRGLDEADISRFEHDPLSHKIGRAHV